jgi:hypothetical protein
MDLPYRDLTTARTKDREDISQICKPFTNLLFVSVQLKSKVLFPFRLIKRIGLKIIIKKGKVKESWGKAMVMSTWMG